MLHEKYSIRITEIENVGVMILLLFTFFRKKNSVLDFSASKCTLHDLSIAYRHGARLDGRRRAAGKNAIGLPFLKKCERLSAFAMHEQAELVEL